MFTSESSLPNVVPGAEEEDKRQLLNGQAEMGINSGWA